MDMRTPPTGENNEDLKVLEIGPSMDPQAWALWDEDQIDYVDVPAQAPFYEGKVKVPDPYIPKYKDALRIYKGRKFWFGDAARLDEFVTEKYDVIFASHVLEHFPWWDTDNVLQSWIRCLKPGGALHVLVPALEWAAEEIMKKTPSTAILPYLHGGIQDDYDVHLCSFTMRYLRARLEVNGLAVAKAVTGEKHINANGQNVVAQQHYCVGFLITDDVDLPPPEKE